MSRGLKDLGRATSNGMKILYKLEALIFYILIFSIPFETRFIWHIWTFPFNQWTAGYIYGTDILLCAFLVLWLVRSLPLRLDLKSIFSPKIFGKADFWLLAFFIVSAISIFNAKIAGLSFYQLIKLAEFMAFYFYIKNNLGLVFKFRTVLITIIFSGLFQSIIAVAQFLKQSNLGLRLFGESPLAIDTTGIAVFIVDSHKYLRAYGTTPHPNVLAVWLFLAIFSFYNFYFYRKSQNISWPLLVAYTAMLFALFFTFSRVIIGLWLLCLVLVIYLTIFSGFLSVIKKRLMVIGAVTLAAVIFFASLYWPLVQSRIHVSADEEAVTQRIFYNKIAGTTVEANPFGIGLGQFVPRLMDKLKYYETVPYQPVHNIYLLIASETGFMGLALFLLFLFFILYNFIKSTGPKELWQLSFIFIFLSLLVFGLFDHLLWTLQQGSLVLWMVMALLSVNRHDAFQVKQ